MAEEEVFSLPERNADSNEFLDRFAELSVGEGMLTLINILLSSPLQSTNRGIWTRSVC